MAQGMAVRTNWNQSKKHTDMERWICIYPAYIDSKKTRKQGRRVAKDLCVEQPTYIEISNVLSVTNLQVGIENQQYPRDPSKELHARGRVRVQIKKEDGSLCNSNFPSRESVMIYVCDKIPQLKTRQNKQNDPSAAAIQQSHQSSSGAGGNKKPRNKRR